MKKLLGTILLTSALALANTPNISWISSPTIPGRTVIVSGNGFTENTTIEINRLRGRAPVTIGRGVQTLSLTSETLEALQVSDQCIKFVLPETFDMGIYAVRFSKEAKPSEIRLINAPTTKWIQGDDCDHATQGGWIRIMGESLGFDGVDSTILLVNGSEKLTVKAEKLAYQKIAEKGMRGIEGEYCLQISLPKTIKKGQWNISVHNGYGGAYGWSDAGSIYIKDTPAWPKTIFTVEGTDQRAIDAAIAKAKENNGGTVFFPTGYYKATKGIEVPAFTTLKGEGMGRVEIRWPGKELKEPPIALIYGKSDFAIENLTIMQHGRHAAGIMCENGFARNGGGNVTIKNVVIRLNSLIGVGNRVFSDPVAELIDRGLIGPSGVGGKEPYGRVAAIMLGGNNIKVENVDVWSTGHPLLLEGVGGIVKDSVFSAPIIGRYWVRACKNLILENNQIECGGVISSYNISYPDNYPFARMQYTTTSSKNILLIGNRFFKSWKYDGEVMTVDSNPGVNLYSGAIEGADENKICLPKDNIYVFSGDAIGGEKCRKQIKTEKTYLVVGRIDSFAGNKWDQLHATLYDDSSGIINEPEEWDINITLRDDKRNLDYLATWGTPGVKLTDFRLGKTYASVVGADEQSLMFYDSFDYTNDDFKNCKTPWFKGGSRFDPNDKNNYCDPFPNKIVDFGGNWTGLLKPSEKAITVTSGGWSSAWRKMPVSVDMNTTQIRYFSFFMNSSNGRAYFGLGAADPNRRTPQDQYHGYAEMAFKIGPGIIPTYKGTIDEENSWYDSLVMIADGKGRGQYRFLKSATDGILEVDRPWDIIPDETSYIVIPRSFSDSIFTANSFEDSGRLQMWGGSFGIVVDGNRFVRSSGLAVMGLEYYGGTMPAWQCKLLNNTRIGFNAASISGSPSEPFFGGPLAGLSIVRGNYDQSAGANGNVVDCLTEYNTDTLRPYKRDDLEGRRLRDGYVQVEKSKEKGREGTWLNQQKGLVIRNNNIIKE